MGYVLRRIQHIILVLEHVKQLLSEEYELVEITESLGVLRGVELQSEERLAELALQGGEVQLHGVQELLAREADIVFGEGVQRIELQFLFLGQ
jgi:hypothetical protein